MFDLADQVEVAGIRLENHRRDGTFLVADDQVDLVLAETLCRIPGEKGNGRRLLLVEVL